MLNFNINNLTIGLDKITCSWTGKQAHVLVKGKTKRCEIGNLRFEKGQFIGLDASFQVNGKKKHKPFPFGAFVDMEFKFITKNAVSDTDEDNEEYKYSIMPVLTLLPVLTIDNMNAIPESQRDIVQFHMDHANQALEFRFSKS